MTRSASYADEKLGLSPESQFRNSRSAHKSQEETVSRGSHLPTASQRTSSSVKSQASGISHLRCLLPKPIHHVFISRAWSRLGGRGAPLQPRIFANPSFVRIPADVQVEEEALPDYLPARYYPMRIGQVLVDRYQVVGKLGFGASSTVWLARDLRYVVAPRKPSHPVLTN